MTDERASREEICAIGRDLYARGHTSGSAGNISARLSDGWLITPTDVCLGRLTPEGIAKADFEGNWVSGPRPSKTVTLHRRIYEQRPDCNGIIHTHSTHLVALTLAGVHTENAILPPITPYQVMKIGRVPLIPYERPGSPKAAARVAELAPSVNGVMLDRLGPVVWGSSVTRASDALAELEETARLWLMTTPRPAPLDDAALADIAAVFGVTWD
ncbi:3-oxo-tetronate 4-phosphate decarboxylase [Gluconobacter oxydans]|uniref:3-oxo-tetronate 4-phosphate decarboxylase n=1 Tax=Gluconobacter oxydans NBRC 3293 TaxID=1315969 RepID=A0A829WSZ7_GLUOY|nr:aldolase [Gluconobacter oxydans]GEM18305.1 aldolase [Gluconobacter oxydans NBRC 3293]